MTNRRSLAPRVLTGAVAATAALAIAASGTTTATAARDTDSYTASATSGAETASLTVLPGIAQPGKGTKASSAASSVFSAKTSPRSKKNRKATLEVFDGVSAWSPVSSTKTNKKGVADFTASSSSLAGKTVRVTFSSPTVSTGPVLADAWGAPTFADDFTGGSLGAAWSHRGQDYNKAGLRNCSKGSPKAVKVKGGTLQLSVMVDKKKRNKTCVAKKANGKKIGKFKYRLNGHISTQGTATIKYGVAAARMKFQKAKGQHASFWMQPNEGVHKAPNAQVGGAEIDIIEWFGTGGRQKGLTSFIYAPTPKGPRKIGGFLKKTDQFLSSKKDDWFKQYHVFSVHWAPTGYSFRIDGQETYSTSKGVSGLPQYVILSLLSSDYELKNLGGEKKLPQKFNVDWVRVWQDPTQV